MKSFLVPLGMRCTAVQVINAIVNQPRFPFDWTQMNAESIRDVIHLESDQIKTFWTNYFSTIDDTKHSIKTGSWFPHDSFTEEEVEATIDKYVRRTERLQGVLNSTTHVTYIIVFGFPEENSMEKVLELTFAIQCRQQGPCSFIVCNGMIAEDERENMVFLYERLGESNGFQDWEDLSRCLEKRVRKVLEEKQIDILPFEWKQLKREGYGSQFNDLYIEGDIFVKIAKNEYGKKKLSIEQQAYSAFKKDAPSFPLAEVFSMTPTTLRLQYYQDSIPLWKFYQSVSLEQRDSLLNTLFHHLDQLHIAKQKTVTKEEFTSLLLQETVTKVRERYKEVVHILEQYPFTKVNGVSCLSFEECLERVEKKTYEYIERQSSYKLSYIHGDPQFNNILINPKTEELVFLDPRGYFGDSLLFGLEEYDKAKIVFALSGYDIFDSTKDFTISIEDNTITIPDFTLDERYISFYPEIHFLLASIWLANSHCFLENPQKLVVSHAIARLLTTRLC